MQQISHFLGNGAENPLIRFRNWSQVLNAASNLDKVLIRFTVDIHREREMDLV